ncbi:MAG: hypothetical protein R3D80_05330 [Paracoccaceae bacterium]
MPFDGSSIQNRISRFTQLSPKLISRQTGAGSVRTRGVALATSTTIFIASGTSLSKEIAIGVTAAAGYGCRTS